MTLTLDPTPFILAAGSTKVTQPTDVSAGAHAGQRRHGVHGQRRGRDAPPALPAGRKGFFQIHLNTAGQPDECRFFSLVDEVHPASEDDGPSGWTRRRG